MNTYATNNLHSTGLPFRAGFPETSMSEKIEIKVASDKIITIFFIVNVVHKLLWIEKELFVVDLAL